MEICNKTDIGKVRTSNQDCVSGNVISDTLAWCAVCDGMGGANGGDVASSLAINVIKENISSSLARPFKPEELEQIMSQAICRANTEIWGKALIDSKLKKMGTTVVLCVVYENSLRVMHAGDSRAYVVHEGKINQVSTDHSIVQEMLDSGEITPKQARKHPQKNIITRALGVNPEIKLDYTQKNVSPGDAMLLCTDGLTNSLDDKAILNIYLKSKNLGEAANMLINEANRCGGSDNITVSLIKL